MRNCRAKFGKTAEIRLSPILAPHIGVPNPQTCSAESPTALVMKPIIELLNPMPELTNLGIMVYRTGVPTYNSTSGAGHALTQFGYSYLKYLDAS